MGFYLSLSFLADCVQSEVVRIEKTLEVVDVTESEEEKTLSISPVFKYPHTEDHTEDDTDVDLEDVDIEHFCYKPKLIITNSERVLKSEIFFPDFELRENHVQDPFLSVMTAPRRDSRGALRNSPTDAMRRHR